MTGVPPPKSANPPASNPTASSGRPPKMNYDPDDDPWTVGSAVPKADPPVLHIFGNVQQKTSPINLPPAATAMGKSGFPEHSAAGMGTESNFPPAKGAGKGAPENSTGRQLPIPKPTGPNKAAKNSTPKIEEVPEESAGDGDGGRMDESFKRNCDVFEDEDKLFGFEYIPEDVSPPWFRITCGESHPQFSRIQPTGMTRIGTRATSPKIWTQQCLTQCMCKASSRGQARRLKKWRGKDMSYHEFIMKIFNHDDEAGQYAKWILAHYAPKITATPKSQAPDLAAFLKKMRVDAFLGATYRRELMNVDFDKKP